MKKFYDTIRAILANTLSPGGIWVVELAGRPIIRLANRESEDIGGIYLGDTYSLKMLSTDLQIDEVHSSTFWENKNLIFRAELGETAVLLNGNTLSFTDRNRVYITTLPRPNGLQLQNTAWNYICRIVRIVFFLVASPMIFFVLSVQIFRASSPIRRILLLLVLFSVIFSVIGPHFLKR